MQRSWIMQRRLCFLKRDALHFWRKWSSDQDDHQGQKSNNETRISNPQSCTWLDIWQNQLGPKNPNQIGWHQKTNSQTYWQRAISHAMNGIIFSSCQYQHFQLSMLPRSVVEKNATRNRRRENCGKVEAQCNVLELCNVDYVSSNEMLYIFEENEAVIKMIIKGRSPTMRHVSPTHRVALDWIFDRINLDPKIQIKLVDTKKPTRRHTDKGQFHTRWME